MGVRTIDTILGKHGAVEIRENKTRRDFGPVHTFNLVVQGKVVGGGSIRRDNVAERGREPYYAGRAVTFSIRSKFKWVLEAFCCWFGFRRIERKETKHWLRSRSKPEWRASWLVDGAPRSPRSKA